MNCLDCLLQYVYHKNHRQHCELLLHWDHLLLHLWLISDIFSISWVLKICLQPVFPTTHSTVCFALELFLLTTGQYSMALHSKTQFLNHSSLFTILQTIFPLLLQVTMTIKPISFPTRCAQIRGKAGVYSGHTTGVYLNYYKHTITLNSKDANLSQFTSFNFWTRIDYSVR